MPSTIVWTKQHESVPQVLEQTGRYVAKKSFIEQDLGDEAPLVLEAYDWLVKNCPIAPLKPKDAEYPIWVSPAREATMMPSPNTVILELEVDTAAMAFVNINKWGAILNYSYIPADKDDDKRHRSTLSEYGISDTQAYMSRFYPQLKRTITNSWHRLFDDSVSMGNDLSYGILWEVKKEWVRQVTR